MQRLLSITILLFSLTACDEPGPAMSGTSGETEGSFGTSTGGTEGGDSSSSGEDSSSESSDGGEESSSDSWESSSESGGDEVCSQFCFTPVAPPLVEDVECASDSGLLEIGEVPLTGVQAICVQPEAADAYACGDLDAVAGQVQTTLIIMCLDYLALQGCAAKGTEAGPGSYEICDTVGTAWLETVSEPEDFIFHAQEVGYTEGCSTDTELSC